MRITEQDKLNLRRFGCTLELKQKLVHIKWTDLSPEQALGATILVRAMYTTCTAGPLLCLALEISPTRALAQYCYFPFNLKNHAHRKYLSSLGQTGQLRLGFLIRGRKIVREHQLTPSQCVRLKELCAEASKALETYPKYGFVDVVEEFENSVRIPYFFERVISESEFAEALKSLKVKSDEVSPGKRALARQLVGRIAGVLDPYRDKIAELLVEMQDVRTGLLLISDLQREFGKDYERLLNFVADGVAVEVEEDILRNSSDWPSKLESIIKLFNQASAAPESEQDNVRSDFTAAVNRTLTDLGSGRGLSLSMLQNLLLPLRPLLTGQPGRPPKDYSREYEWKGSGLSWSDVTMRHLRENPETRAEFGGRDLASLTFEEKENLRNRVREGVRSYAERTGKTFPVPEPSTSIGEPPLADNPLDTLHSRKSK